MKKLKVGQRVNFVLNGNDHCKGCVGRGVVNEVFSDMALVKISKKIQCEHEDFERHEVIEIFENEIK